MMKVRALKSFGSTEYGHVSAGSEFELPDGVDWLTAGLVEPVIDEPEAAVIEPPEKAVKPRVTRRKAKGK